ncbi:acryloyl-CoA reductase [Oceanobacillus sp. J11TS1]|uniref:acrylyl-CoA reductase family protein n=1 Tax=Oceanobacillus sp. J11TS1 TaxID=2807191 RepID=UPI001B0EB8C5|nr:acryloyl-CoA reductase [Oceanobacillus sp. J11TS1]GIO24088.1 putative quinone oxidoreductase YhfP [Oceanobacillus sp. J11TS1]
MGNTFKALVIEQENENLNLNVKEMELSDLPDGEVLIKVKYSGINYKDGLAAHPNGNIVKEYPFIPGIDLAGEVVDSKDDRYQKGDQVIVTSYELGVSHFGGYSEYARVHADWVVPLPEGLSLKESMILGTAGFTAALSVQRLEANGLKPESGSVLVTGATGGVGSIAISLLKKRGYHVTASTGKSSEEAYLKQLGADEVVDRDEVYNGEVRKLDKQKWAGAVDAVGGEPLASLLSQIKYLGSVAVSGMAAGVNVPSTVFPFILRGVSLLGIDSVYCPMEERKHIWERLATDLKLDNLEELVFKEVVLEALPDILPSTLESNHLGRVLVNLEK